MAKALCHFKVSFTLCHYDQVTKLIFAPARKNTHREPNQSFIVFCTVSVLNTEKEVKFSVAAVAILFITNVVIQINRYNVENL